MKYEMIFGDEALFDGAPDECFCVAKNVYDENVYYKAVDACLFWLDGGKWKPLQFMSCTPIAMRCIIKEPKRWTWEDKKAGRLPDVGCKCVGILRGVIKRVVHVNKDIVAVEIEESLNVCSFTHEEFFRSHKPIETPAEKAQREEDEFIGSLAGTDIHDGTVKELFEQGARAAYRKLKGGE